MWLVRHTVPWQVRVALLRSGRRVVSSIEPCRLWLALVWAALFGVSSVALPARAEPISGAASPRQPEQARDERAPIALVTGLAVAGLSFGVGGFLLASERELPGKHAGLAVLHGGLTLAPLAAHGVVGEWGRGAWFSIPPALGGIGMAVLLSQRPEAPVKGKNKSHRIYPVLLTVSVLGSAVGIFDAALVDERAPVRVRVAASDDFGGAWIEGSF